MPRFRKKPVVIEAVQVTAADYNPRAEPSRRWDGSPFSSAPAWLVKAMADGVLVPVADDRDYAVWDVRTLEGAMRAEPGDWIIRGVKGELYPCKSDIFAATYDPVDDEPDDEPLLDGERHRV